MSYLTSTHVVVQIPCSTPFNINIIRTARFLILLIGSCAAKEGLDQLGGSCVCLPLPLSCLTQQRDGFWLSPLQKHPLLRLDARLCQNLRPLHLCSARRQGSP